MINDAMGDSFNLTHETIRQSTQANSQVNIGTFSAAPTFIKDNTDIKNEIHSQKSVLALRQNRIINSYETERFLLKITEA